MVKYYRHFKGGKYKLLAVGQDSETLAPVVVYQALYGEGKVGVRNWLFCPPDNLFQAFGVRKWLSGTPDHRKVSPEGGSYLPSVAAGSCTEGSPRSRRG